MTLDHSRRIVTDAAGDTWLAWETMAGRTPALGARKLEPSPWITFTNEQSGARVSGFAAASLDELNDDQLTRLLEEMLRREDRW
ncbi:MAG: hypothetical protein ACREL7_00595 [Longimicrobiales bacterium]